MKTLFLIAITSIAVTGCESKYEKTVRESKERTDSLLNEIDNVRDAATSTNGDSIDKVLNQIDSASTMD